MITSFAQSIIFGTIYFSRVPNTLRKRLARFVRMMLSFSKSEVMLRPLVCLSFFIAIIQSGPTCSSEPLPIFVLIGVLSLSRQEYTDRPYGSYSN
jgi:hypothetical protein